MHDTYSTAPTYRHVTFSKFSTNPMHIEATCFFFFPIISASWTTKSTIKPTSFLLRILFSLCLNLGDYDNTINVQICTKKERLHVLLSLLERDAPKSGIIFVAEQVLVYMMFF
jgi:hypothetical protein